MPNLSETSLATLITRHLADILCLQPTDIAAQASFFELGLDSLMGVELIKRLERDLGPDVPITGSTVFEHPNIAALARYLAPLAQRQPTHASTPSVSPSLRPVSPERAPPQEPPRPDRPFSSADALTLIKQHVAELCAVDAAQLSADMSFDELGMGPAERVELISRLKSEDGIPGSLATHDTYEHPSLLELAQHLSCGPASSSATRPEGDSLETRVLQLIEAVMEKRAPRSGYEVSKLKCFPRALASANQTATLTARVEGESDGELLIRVVEEALPSQSAATSLPFVVASARVSVVRRAER